MHTKLEWWLSGVGGSFTLANFKFESSSCTTGSYIQLMWSYPKQIKICLIYSLAQSGPAGGRFAEPRAFSEKLLGDAAASGGLRQTAPGVAADEGLGLEFTDGTSVVGNSVTGNRTRILSPAFSRGASKLDRTWDVIGGEGKCGRLKCA